MEAHDIMDKQGQAATTYWTLPTACHPVPGLGANPTPAHVKNLVPFSEAIAEDHMENHISEFWVMFTWPRRPQCIFAFRGIAGSPMILSSAGANFSCTPREVLARLAENSSGSSPVRRENCFQQS